MEIIVLGTFITLIIGAIQKILFVAKFIVRIHSTFWAGDLGIEGQIGPWLDTAKAYVTFIEKS